MIDLGRWIDGKYAIPVAPEARGSQDESETSSADDED